MKFVLIFLTAFSAGAFAKPAVVCQTKYKIDGWKAYDTHDYLRFTAYVESSTKLTKAVVSGAYASDVRTLKADKKYKPVSARYEGYNRFEVLEDAWNWFAPLLPKNFTELDGPFTGYIQITDEDGFKGTERLNCFVSSAE